MTSLHNLIIHSERSLIQMAVMLIEVITFFEITSVSVRCGTRERPKDILWCMMVLSIKIKFVSA